MSFKSLFFSSVKRSYHGTSDSRARTFGGISPNSHPDVWKEWLEQKVIKQTLFERLKKQSAPDWSVSSRYRPILFGEKYLGVKREMA